jgi:hypothetical protein
MSRLFVVVAGFALPTTVLAAPGEWVPSAPEAALIQQLSLRDGSPPCAEMEASLPAPAASLKAVVQNVQMPPWVPMRAAECLLVGHATESKPELLDWVTRPELKGLGLLALGRLDAMPVELATEVATTAIARGPDPASARVRVARAVNPAIAGLAAVKE